MPERRQRKTKLMRASQEAQQPSWKQPLPRRRRRTRKQQAVSVRTSLSELKRTLAAPRPGPTKAGRAAAARRARPQVHVPWRRLILLPLLAGVAFMLLQFFTREEFYIYSAQVRGNQRVSAEDIYQASGIDSQHIFWVRPAAAALRIAALPGVSEAHVSMALPNQVVIDVQEREPLVAWRTESTTLWIAADGGQVPQVGGEPPLLLADSQGEASDGHGSLRRSVLADLVTLHLERPDLTTVSYGVQEGLNYLEPQGFTVYLGSQGDVKGKLALLQAAQGQIAERKPAPKVIDLRVAGNVYLR
jgi:cell division septal protein FtsQ